MPTRSSFKTAALFSALLASAPAGALTITLNFDSGQSASPAFDPTGAQLQAIMQAAASRWQRVIALGHNLTINFWYDDISPLGENQSIAFVGDRDTVADIRIDTMDGAVPRQWFFDPTPDVDEEFNMTQRLYRDLGATQQTQFFNGAPPDLLEVGYTGTALFNAPPAAQSGYDLLTVALHEIGHSLGVPVSNPANTEANDFDYDFNPGLIGGATAAARGDGALGFDTDHLGDNFALMKGGLNPGARRRISATDVLAADAGSTWTILNLWRKEFLGATSVQYNNSANWVGGLVPVNNDIVDIRHGATAFLGAESFAGDLNISGTGTGLTSFAFTMNATGNTDIDDGGTLTLGNNFNGQFGVLNGGSVTIGRFGTGTLVFDEGQALISGDLTTFNSGTVEGHGLIRVGGDLLNGGTIRALGDGETLTLETTGSGRLGLDGFIGAGGNGDIVVGNGSDNVLLDIDAPLADSFSGDLFVTSGGTIDFADPWSVTTSGDFFLTGGSIEGGKLDFAGILQLTGSSRITAPVDFNAFTRVAFSNLNAELELFGTTDYGDWITINPGNGTLRQTGDASFSGAITLDLNIYDMDGRNENSFITIGNDVTINATQLDIADNVFNGTMEITEPAKLTVNTASAWEMAGTLNLIGAFVAGPEPVLLDGAPIVISGFVEADGHSQIDAQVTIGSTGQIDFPNVGGTRGLVLGAAAHTITGGQVTGDGALGAVSGAALTGFGTVSADVDFDSGSTLMADNGTLTLSGDIQHAGVLGTASAAGVLMLTQPLNAGTVDEIRLNGGTVQGANISHAGTTSGSGMINVTSFTTTGTTSPGLSFGVLAFQGDFQHSAGTIAIEIGGTTPGVNADQIVIGQSAALAGARLELQTSPGFDPALSTVYTVIDAGSIANPFDEVDGRSISADKVWAVTYEPDAVRITAAKLGDLDLDNDIDDADFGIAFAAFTGPNNGPSSNPNADLDFDGDVDDADFGIAFAAFTGPNNPANIPEPTSLAILSLGGLALLRRR